MSARPLHSATLPRLRCCMPFCARVSVCACVLTWQRPRLPRRESAAGGRGARAAAGVERRLRQLVQHHAVASVRRLPALLSAPNARMQTCSLHCTLQEGVAAPADAGGNGARPPALRGTSRQRGAYVHAQCTDSPQRLDALRKEKRPARAAPYVTFTVHAADASSSGCEQTKHLRAARACR